MLKILKGFVYLMAVLGFGAVGYLLWQGFERVRETALVPGGSPLATTTATLVTSAPAPAAAVGTAPAVRPPADPALAAIVQSYQQQAASEVTAAGATAGGAATGAAGGGTSSLANKPVRTPGPTDKIIRGWPTGRKWVALTYDDGPHPEHTPKLMELLRSKGVKATFFVVGPMIEKNPDILKSLADNGFEIANHTWNHPEFRRATAEKIREELQKTNDIIKEVAGVQPRVMRPPFGQAPKAVQEVTDELGLKIVTWNIDTEDWKRAGSDAMINNIMKNLSDGAIVLMHDTRGEKVYETTEKVIDQIREKGFEFVTVSEMLGLQPVTPAGVPAAQPQPAAPVAAPAAVQVAPSPAAPQVAAPAAAAGGATREPVNLPAPADAPPSVERKLPEVSPDKQTVPNAVSR